MEQGKECRYWTQEVCNQGSREAQLDYPGNTGEPFMDNLLDRSGLFDELVCQILDESRPNQETERKTVTAQGNQPPDAASVEEKHQGLDIVAPSGDVPLTWTKSNAEMSHENAGPLKFPPGIMERPTHPASFDAVYQGISLGSLQESAAPVARVPEQPRGKGKQAATNGDKNMAEFVPNEHFMKGDHLEVPMFRENFSERPSASRPPSSGGDGGGSLPVPESLYGPPSLGGLSQRNRLMGFRGSQEGRRSSPVPDDPHQYFRQRASALHQANSRELLMRQNRPPYPFASNDQQNMNRPFPQNLELKAQLMQMNMGNVENVNKLVTKGNLNLHAMAFGYNQYPENIGSINSSCGQNRLPNHPFPMQRMSSHQVPYTAPNQNHGMQTPGHSGQFQEQSCPPRPEFYSNLESLNNWQPPTPTNDNQSYLDQLHIQLESCYYQFYSMEKERKKTEMELSRLNPGRRISSANTIQTPQLPDNPTSLDRMIVDFYKEHSRVYTLMSKIGGLCAEALHPNIDACLDSWVEAIQEAGIKRKEELRRAQDGNAEWSQQRGCDQIDVIQKLAKATRSIRTALWCALQMSKEKTVLQDSGGSPTLIE